MTELIELLQQRYQAQDALDLMVAIEIAHEPGSRRVCLIDLHNDEIVAAKITSEHTQADLTLYFDSTQRAIELLCESASPIDAFMEGGLRSSGYIVETFAVLRLFNR